MSAATFWRMTQGKVMEGVFGSSLPPISPTKKLTTPQPSTSPPASPQPKSCATCKNTSTPPLFSRRGSLSKRANVTAKSTISAGDGAKKKYKSRLDMEARSIRERLVC